MRSTPSTPQPALAQAIGALQSVRLSKTTTKTKITTG
ncbi:MAG: hypothetical protein RI972_1295 [Pseudomonadota bacterium]|jgi:hypothetical protein